MSSTDDVIARARETLDRTSERYRTGVGRRARQNDVAKRIGRAGAANLLIVAIAVAVGLFVMPIGMGGFLAMILAMAVASIVLMALPTAAPPTPERLRAADIKALPAQTGRWLDAQRPLLPAPAINLVDQIGLKLDALTPQLVGLNDDAPAAAEIRKLVAEQLPEFVKGYEAVPQGLRGVERNGKTPDQQLVDGLGLIGRQIDEMAAQLAQGDLDALSTRGRYLEIKYQGDGAGV